MPQSAEFQKGYERAEEDLMLGKDLINPYAPGTDEQKGYSEAAHNLTK